MTDSIRGMGPHVKNRPFFRIALTGSQLTEQVVATLALLHHFLTDFSRSVVCDSIIAARLPFAVQSVPETKLGVDCDLLIVVGGDGSMLHAAKIAVSQDIPILGINKGHLGFLTDISPDKLDSLRAILAGEYQIEERFLLQGTLFAGGEKIQTLQVLNEVVLSASNIARMIACSVEINKKFVCTLRADGLIVATPTGSTAYALSGGGPILEPSLNAIVWVPMFPHTLSNRPLVMDADAHIMIKIPPGRVPPVVSGDGKQYGTTQSFDTLSIKKAKRTLKLVHANLYEYFETLRSKLNWQSKQWGF